MPLTPEETSAAQDIADAQVAAAQAAAVRPRHLNNGQTHTDSLSDASKSFHLSRQTASRPRSRHHA